MRSILLAVLAGTITVLILGVMRDRADTTTDAVYRNDGQRERNIYSDLRLAYRDGERSDDSGDTPPLVVIIEIKEVETYGIDPEIVRIVCAYDWDCGTALSVVLCESRGDAQVRNPSGATGLFQVMLPLHGWRFLGGDPFDPRVNANVAWLLYSEQGWAPWYSTIGCWGG